VIYPEGYTVGYQSSEDFTLIKIVRRVEEPFRGYYVIWEDDDKESCLSEEFVVNCDKIYSDKVRQVKLERILQ